MEDFWPGQRSQDAEYMYFPNGAVFVISTKILESQKTFYTERDLIGFEMSWLESLDIDDWEDYELAQVIARALG